MAAAEFSKGIIQPTLIDQLRSILDQYPDDNQILKELIQNAEDAGASRVTFLYDRTQYACDKLHNSALSTYQGPALYAYNDARFSKDDWESVRMIHKSLKRDDPMKVGRFGLGFKSVFHITDLPGVLSGDQVGFLDPHEEFFETVTERGGRKKTSSFAWNLSDASLQAIPDQMAPFKQALFGGESDYERVFPGTLFRFPLRQKDHKSDISSTEYNDAKIRQLFDMFRYEAHEFLLFLNSLEQIEIYEKDGPMQEPRLLLSVKVSKATQKEVRAQRARFKSGISALSPSKTWLPQPVVARYRLETEVQVPGQSAQVRAWLVTQYFDGGGDTSLKNILLNNSAKMLPWVGVALPLDRDSQAGQGDGHGAGQGEPGGQVFCFLPLPTEQRSATGFHFHVHGYFAVDQNRRHLKWPSADYSQAKHKDHEREWNSKMAGELVPRALRELVLHAVSRGDAPTDVYRLFPNPGAVQEQWSGVVSTFYRLMQGERVYHSAESGGRWVTAGEACRIQQGDAHTDVLTRILLDSSLTSNLVCPPQYIVDAMAAAGRPKLVEPGLVKKFVAAMNTKRLSEDERAALLQYFTHHRAIHMLKDLKLCQLEGGVLTTFATQCYHVACDVRCLLPGLHHLFHAPASGQLDSTLSTIAKSGMTGLRDKGANDVPELLTDMFRQTTQPVTLNSNQTCGSSHFKLDNTWLDSVWDHIERHSYDIPVSRYEGLPLLLSNSKLYSLTKSQPYIRNGSHDNVGEILQKLGFLVVEQVHSKAEQYVQSFDPEGVLKAMTTMPDYVNKIRQLQDKDKTELRGFLASISSTQYNNILIKLPIFETFLTLNESDSESNKWKSGEHKAEGYSGKTCVPLPQGTRVLDLQIDSVKRLAQTVGVTVINDMHIFTDCILPKFDHYSNEEKIKITSKILTKLEKYKGIENTIKGLECILTTSGDFKRPSDIFDPNDQKIKALFGDFDLLPFPKQPFTDDVFLVKLRRLGMCGIDDIKAEQLLKLAQHVDKQAQRNDNKSKIKKQGKALADFLNDHHNLLKSQVAKDRSVTKLKDAVSELRFIPFKKERSYSYETHIPWFHDELCLAKPCDVSTQYYLVGSQMPTPEGTYTQLSKAYSWDRYPPSDAVLRQLQTVIGSHSNGHGMSTSVTKIYKYLQSDISQNRAFILQKLAELGDWIWSGSSFVAPSQVVFTSDLGISAAPYIHMCLPALTQYRQLFAANGVTEHADWPDVLERIKDYHDDNHPSRDECKRDKAIVMAILSKIIERDELTDDLLIPINTSDNTLNLKTKSQCTFCDAEWMQRGHAEEDIDDLGKDIFIVHSEISQKLAQKLGVPSFMSRYLDAEELDMSYGQTEPLTRRIHNILEDYKDGSAVLKELLQNADDAGATEVAFIYDRRNMASSSETLLDRNMKSLQGPAIWAYNNAVFSDEDFENIVKLSGATKKDQPTKIGRFGLGFNAVYHLSDVPSFVSRNNIVFFDPHTKYLGHSIRNSSKPGIKLSMQKHAPKIKRFGDQFKPYIGIFGLDMATYFDGTLFRLPLRTKEQASKSDISEKVYDNAEVNSLFDLLLTGAEGLLLFTQFVRKVTVYTIDENESDSPTMRQNFVIERSIDNVIRPMFTNSQDKEEESKILYLSNKAQAHGGKHSNCFVTKVTVSGTVPGKNVSADSRTCHWVICGAIGNKVAKSLADDHKDLLPVGGVAGRLELDSENNKYRLDMLKQNESQIFCFLPLPIRHELPVHVNGYFAVTSSRNHLHDDEETEKSDVRALWNRALMEDAVCAAYLDMFCCILKSDRFDQEHLMENIFDFFPGNIGEKVKGRSNPAFCLMKAFLEGVFLSGDRQMLPSGNVWVDGKTFRALDRNAKNSELSDQMTQVCRTIFNNNEDKHFVDMPFAVYNDLESCNIVDLISDRLITVEAFYRDVFLPNVHLLPIDVTEDLILHALTNFNHRFDSLLKEHACIPVFAGEGQPQFKRPGVLVDPRSSLAGLFDRDEGYFPLRILETTSSIERENWKNGLLRLGMKENSLENEEVLERARSIQYMPDSGQAVKRSDCLLMLLDKLEKEDMAAIGHDLQNIQFIKWQSKPSHWKLPWKGDQLIELLSIRDVFDDEFEFMGTVCPLPKFDHYSSKRRLKEVKKKLSISVKLEAPHIVEFIQECSTYMATKVESNENKSWYLTTGFDMRKLVFSCYEWCKGNTSNINFTQIRDIPFIFINQDVPILVKPSQCFKNLPTDCKPFLYKVPNEIVSLYPYIIDALMIPTECEPQHYVAKLKSYSADVEVVPEKDRSAILNIVKALAKSLDTLGKTCDLVEKRAELDPIYVLNDEWNLCINSDLNFNTTDWLTTDMKSKLCNMHLTPIEAHALGVKTTRDALLDEFTLGVSFGQHEELTNRIKRLLDGYPCDKEVLKELLQNADDAGASEIHFILDERTHRSARVFSDSWQQMQGPALLVYNDKPFLEKDIKGIQRLGEGSKADDAITTGKYGVGFNCVYHLTDTPTFLSKGAEIGERLCAFDPQCKYVPASGKRNPGRMFMVNQNIRSEFKDVFDCYDIPDVNRPESTLFRFPLRCTKTMAQDSLFSENDIPVTTNDVRKLFDRFKEEMPIMLLFLRNVRKITISETAVDGSLNVISQTESSVSAEDALKKEKYNAAVREAGRALKQGSVDVNQVSASEVAYNVEINSDDMIQKFLVCNRIGFSELDEVSTDMVKDHKRQKAAILPRGGVAYCLSTKKNKHGKANEKGANKGKVDDTKLISKPKLFSFLPLPQESHLPMHVNGHFILDGETRHDIFETDKLESFKSQWNEMLLGVVIAGAYVRALEEIKVGFPSAPVPYMEIHSQFDIFIHAFPHKSLQHLRPLMQALQRSVYCNIIKREHLLIPVLKRQDIKSTSKDFPRKETVQLVWQSTKNKVFFDALELQMPAPKVSPTSSVQAVTRPAPGTYVQNVLLNLRFPFTGLPRRCKERFSEAMKKQQKSIKSQKDHSSAEERDRIDVVTPQDVVDFLARYKEWEDIQVTLPCAVEQSPFVSPESVKHIVDYVAPCKAFKGLPLLLTMDEMLHEFQNSGAYVLASQFSVLVPECSNRFLHHIYGIYYEWQCPGIVAMFSPFVRHMNIEEFAAIIEYHLDPHVYRAQNQVDAESSLFDEQWMTHLYQFLHSQLFVSKTPDRSGEVEFKPPNLEPLRQWCLVPAIIAGNVFFTKLENVSLLFKSIYIDLKALNKLPLPHIHITSSQMKSKEINEVLNQLAASTAEPYQLLKALVHHLKDHSNLDSVMDRRDSDEILMLFQSHIKKLQGYTDAVKLLRQLPVHAAISGKFVPLSDRRVVCVPSNVHKADLHKLPSDRDVFLEESHSLQALYKFIGCSHTTFEEFYCRYVLNNTQKLSDKALYQHVQAIRFHLEIHNYAAKYACLVQSVKRICFINKGDGERHMACEFYNPDVSLFQVMHSGDDFPSDPYDIHEWRPFLERVGLISEVTDQMCIDYARQIESHKRPYKKCSKALVKFIIQKKKNSIDTLKRLADVKFIPHEQVPVNLTEIAPAVSFELVSYSSSMEKHFAEQCWTVLPILPDWAVPSSVSRSGQLVRTPANDQVIQHMQNLVDHCKKTLQNKAQSKVERLQQMFVASILHLESNGLDNTHIRILKNQHCVISDNGLFLKPQHIVAKIDTEWTEIQPGVLEIPRKYVQVEKVLKRLGMTETITFSQTIDVLHELYIATKGDILNPNQLVRGTVATKILFTHVYKQGSAQVQKLYLPTKEKGMICSSEIVLIDRPEYLLRRVLLSMPSLVKLDIRSEKTRDIPIAIQRDVVAKLPLVLRPKVLSQIVEERLDDNCLNTVTPSRVADELQNKLQSGIFRDCILRMLRHDQKETLSSNEDNMRMLETVEEALSQIRVVGIAEITTYLWQGGVKIDESGIPLPFFISNDDGQTATIYVTPRAFEHWLLLSICLSDLIIQLSPLFKDQVCLKRYLAYVIKETTANMVKVLDDLKVTAFNGRALREDRPQTGEYVPQKYIGMLEQTYAKLAIDEYVAFEIDDPLLEDDQDGVEQSEATYIFVRIVSVIIPDDDRDPADVLPVYYKYTVDIGSGRTDTIDAVYLYRFREKRVYTEPEIMNQEKSLVLHSNPQTQEHSNPQAQEHSNPQAQKKPRSPQLDKSLDDIKDYITQCLVAAKLVEERERRAIWKRLRFEFHPDKNPERIQIATQAFQFLQSQIERLMRGENISKSSSSDDCSPGRSGSHSSYDWFSQNSANFASRARRHQEQRETFNDDDDDDYFSFGSGGGGGGGGGSYRSHGGSSGGFYSGRSHHQEKYRANPQPGLARRWLQQASHDLQAAPRDMTSQDQQLAPCESQPLFGARQVPYEWACFKVFQAAKKATRAAQYAVDAAHTEPQWSTLHACGCDDAWTQLKQLVGTEEHMQYPSRSTYQGVPRDRYTAAMATQARDLATQILDACRDHIHQQN